MNLLINDLPTRTWNKLHMNGARVDLDDRYENKKFEVVSKPENISWNPEAADASRGAVRELEPVLEEIPAEAASTCEGTVMEEPLVLRLMFKPGEKKASNLVLHAEKNSCLKAVVLLEASRNAGETAVLETEIYADDNAKVEIYLVQLLNGCCVNHIGGVCGKNANITLTRLELGASRLYSGVNIDLQGEGSTFRAEVGYHARPAQELDMNYVALHHGKKTESLMEINGTLEDKARKIFRGTIDFQQGCAGAKGTENENVLLMSEDVVNQTLPVILCKEEDVEGNHGASIGQLDEKILFYLGSRGISPEAARDMIAKARIEAVCQKIPDESVQALVREFSR